MNMVPFTLTGAELHARGSGALWWPARRLLCVSDLHLGKSERMARRGGAMLPPYETLDTIIRLSDEIDDLDPAHVLALGDSFDDSAAAAALSPEARDALLRLGAGRRWTWITGNHDPAPVDLAGAHLAELRAGPLVFRHIADPSAGPGEVSGHFHPKARLAGRTRRCFLIDGTRAILPAFGTYTGGLDCRAAPLASLMGPEARAVLTGARPIAVPLGAAQPRARTGE